MSLTTMNRRIIAVSCALWLASAGATTAYAAGLTDSASKVDVSAQYVSPTDDQNRPRIRVRLNIADGWHVNANPASLDFLIPTTIDAKADGKALPLSITWPQGHDSGIELGGTEIKVYSDGTVIPVQLESAAIGTREQIELDVRVQSCSDAGLCLPPSTLKIQPTQS